MAPPVHSRILPAAASANADVTCNLEGNPAKWVGTVASEILRLRKLLQDEPAALATFVWLGHGENTLGRAITACRRLSDTVLSLGPQAPSCPRSCKFCALAMRQGCLF